FAQVRLILAGLLAFLVLAAPARALDVYEEVDANGDPVVSATGTKDPISWQACLAQDCRAFNGAIWRAGETPAGTVFTATAGAESASTPAWGGRIKATAAPSLTGTFVVGGTVKPVAAQWSGGWGTELDDLRVEACYDATTCRTLSAPDWIKGGDGSVVLDA